MRRSRRWNGSADVSETKSRKDFSDSLAKASDVRFFSINGHLMLCLRQLLQDGVPSSHCLFGQLEVIHDTVFELSISEEAFLGML